MRNYVIIEKILEQSVTYHSNHGYSTVRNIGVDKQGQKWLFYQDIHYHNGFETTSIDYGFRKVYT